MISTKTTKISQLEAMQITLSAQLEAKSDASNLQFVDKKFDNYITVKAFTNFQEECDKYAS